jgi:hypothetical protein
MKARSAIGFGVISADDFVYVPPRTSEEEIERQIHEAATKVAIIGGGYWRARDAIESLRAQFDDRDVVRASLRSAIRALDKNNTPKPYGIRVGARSGKTTFLKAVAETMGSEVQEMGAELRKLKTFRLPR